MVLRTATKDENVPRPHTSIMVAIAIETDATLAHIWHAREYGPDGADAQKWSFG